MAPICFFAEITVSEHKFTFSNSLLLIDEYFIPLRLWLEHSWHSTTSVIMPFVVYITKTFLSGLIMKKSFPHDKFKSFFSFFR